MKGYVKGLVTGLLIGAAVTAVPAVAENIDALFNEVRININGIDRVQWGENITLGDGTQTPYSILYNGTTYLPLRKTAELLGKEVYWNGDSKTVSVVDSGRKTTVAQKPDKNGNVWKYSTVETADGDCYLIAEDNSRDYKRAYKLGTKNVRVTDDAIYFLKDGENEYIGTRLMMLFKLSFDNDKNTQDGEELYKVYHAADAVFDGDYLFCLVYSPGNAGHGEFVAYNYVNDTETTYRGDTYYFYSNIALEQSDDNKALLSYDWVYRDTPLEGRSEIEFDKITNTFGEPEETVWEDA